MMLLFRAQWMQSLQNAVTVSVMLLARLVGTAYTFAVLVVERHPHTGGRLATSSQAVGIVTRPSALVFRVVALAHDVTLRSCSIFSSASRALAMRSSRSLVSPCAFFS